MWYLGNSVNCAICHVNSKIFALLAWAQKEITIILQMSVPKCLRVDILVPANPGPRGKMAVKAERIVTKSLI